MACGSRIGGRSPLLSQLLRRLHDPGAARTAAAGAPARGKVASAISPPPLRVWALLTAAFLGFGVVVGAAASSGARDRLAASSRAPLRVVVPAGPAGAAAGGAGAEAGSSAGGVEEGSLGKAEAAPARAAHRRAKPITAKSPTNTTSAVSGTGEAESAQPSAGGHAAKLPPVKHVFVITLSDQPYAAVFGPESPAPYLAKSLERQGELLVRYYAVAHHDLPNEVALISGQGPTPQTGLNCPTYTDIAQPGTATTPPAGASGCVYPPSVRTLAGQLAAKHLTWRAYVEGLQEQGRGPCAHPAAGAADPTALPGAAQPYATFRDPFVYFHSIADSSSCPADDVGIGRLAGDLKTPARTPSFSYIAPDRCHDASPAPCAPGALAGLAAADTFLRRVVPEILAAPAYKHDGMLVITVDQAPAEGELADSSSCCGQPLFPDLPAANGAGAPPGGGQVGALLLSPFVKAATTSQEPYNHFSLLRTIEDLFGVQHLGYAGGARVTAFEPSVFSAYKG